MKAQGTKQCGLFWIVGEDRATIAVASERLHRKKAGCRVAGQGADTTTLVTGAKCLRRISHNSHAVASRNLIDAVVIRRVAEQINGNNHARHETEALSFGDARLEAGRVRSEEQTSELQSLIRNSYAVFC